MPCYRVAQERYYTYSITVLNATVLIRTTYIFFSFWLFFRMMCHIPLWIQMHLVPGTRISSVDYTFEFTAYLSDIYELISHVNKHSKTNVNNLLCARIAYVWYLQFVMNGLLSPNSLHAVSILSNRIVPFLVIRDGNVTIPKKAKLNYTWHIVLSCCMFSKINVFI